MGPSDRGGRGAGPVAHPDRFLHLDPRGGRSVGRRVRRRGADARPGGHRHAGACQLDGALGRALSGPLSGRNDEGRRRVSDQRPVEGNRPSARLHLRDAGFPRRPARGAVRQHQPCRRHRRARDDIGRAECLRGGTLHPHHALRGTGNGRPDAGRHRGRERARARPGGGRPPFPRLVQRCRLPPAGRDDGRVRDRRPRHSHAAHHRAVGGGDAGGDPRAQARHLPQRDADRRAGKPGRSGGGDDGGRGRDRRRLRRHERNLVLRDQRSALLHRGLHLLRRPLHRRPPGPQQCGIARADPGRRAARHDPQRRISGAGRGPPRHRADAARRCVRMPRPGDRRRGPRRRHVVPLERLRVRRAGSGRLRPRGGGRCRTLHGAELPFRRGRGAPPARTGSRPPASRAG